VRLFSDQEKWLRAESARRQVSAGLLIREALSREMKRAKEKKR
jgi:hypothetical protein